MLAPLRVEREQLRIGRKAPEVRDDRAHFVGRERHADAFAFFDQSFGVASKVHAHAGGGWFS